MKVYKRILLSFVVIVLCAFPLILSSCFITDVFSGSDSVSTVEIKDVEKSGNEKVSEEDIIALIENQDFLETFNTFYYPDSNVKDARSLESEDKMLYVILEADEDFDEVEQYYKDKKVQSIWSRDFIYQKSMAKVEEEFIETEEEDIPISKFTFSSKDKDRIVDILVKDLDIGRTQIMITCWNLQ